MTLTPSESSTQTSTRSGPWPLWATAAGMLGVLSTVIFDKRAGDTDSSTYMVTAADMADLDHMAYRIGGLLGYATVLALLVFAALWHRRVSQRHSWSVGAHVVTFGLVAAAAALTLAYGWKGALGNYLHGAAEEGTYDDQGLYTYYVMNDFSPYIGWVPVAIALFGLAWMGLREGLVSRGLAIFSGGFGALLFVAVAVTGVPGLPFASMLALIVIGLWLALGRSAITQD